MEKTITPLKDGVSSRDNSLDVLTKLYAVDLGNTRFGADRLPGGEDDKNLTPRFVDILPGPRYDRTDNPYRFKMEHTYFKVSAVATIDKSGNIVFETDPSSPDESSVESLVADFLAFLDGRNIPYERKD